MGGHPRSNATYREWIKDTDHITAARPLRRGGRSGDGTDSGGEASPSAKNNAAAVAGAR